MTYCVVAGLIVSQGELWRSQRFLLSSAFRIEILEETAVSDVM